MSPDALIALLAVVACFALLAFSRMSPDVIFLGAIGTLLLTGRFDADVLLAGYANPGLVTVGLLFVVAAGVRETGVSTIWVQRMLGGAASAAAARARLMVPTSIVSAFLNNTPVVALLLPVVHDWARRNRIAPSRLLIPLSYASILGGLCTLIGTSTNLIVNGLVVDAGMPELAMFEITPLGVICAAVGLLFIILLGDRLLPDRRGATGQLAAAREYTLEMVVEPGSPLEGKTIEEAGLRHLAGAYLVEINRGGHILPAVGPRERLRGGDQLVFVGVVESMADLQRIPGLVPANEQVFKLDAPRPERILVEAVVSNTCPFIGQTIRDARFRTYYDAVVIAVSRNGRRVQSKIGDIVLQPGDTLLLEAHPSFIDLRRDSRDFFLVSRVDELSPPRYEVRWVAIGILAAMTAAVTFKVLTMLAAAFAASTLMIVLRVCTQEAARRAVDWRLLTAIGAAIGLGNALQTSGAAAWLADDIVSFAARDPRWALAGIYLTTVLMTELVTNNAAAVIMFPIALMTAQSLDVSPMPFIMALMIGASASFSTPMGYQTNLMVYGPGGYRFSDFLRIGIPLNLLIGTIVIVCAPVLWPF